VVGNNKDAKYVSFKVVGEHAKILHSIKKQIMDEYGIKCSFQQVINHALSFYVKHNSDKLDMIE
jgi:hypothetical protein